ncbi:MAG: hypothetical protein AAF466_05020 [Bacteroidota bacterium]
MMLRNQIGTRIMAIWLFALLMLPTVVEFTHACDSHQVTVCDETDSHLHQIEADCELCDLLLTTFNYDLTTAHELSIVAHPVLLEVNVTSIQDYSFQQTNTRLRAPPATS